VGAAGVLRLWLTGDNLFFVCVIKPSLRKTFGHLVILFGVKRIAVELDVRHIAWRDSGNGQIPLPIHLSSLNEAFPRPGGRGNDIGISSAPIATTSSLCIPHSSSHIL
jgi:hypothetical protein